MKLYPDQLKVADEFKAWLFESQIPFAGLWASGGYGKSYMVAHLLSILKKTDYPVICASMTHVAAEVLSNFINQPVTTLHATFGWYLEECTDTGKILLMASDKCPVKHGSVVIVDEAGMVSNQVLEALIDSAQALDLRILFVGDNKQTFPVEPDGVPLGVPAYDYCKVKFELTVPKRQAEGDVVFALCQRLRKSVDGGRFPNFSTIMKDGKGVIDTDDFDTAIIEAYDEASHPDKVKVLCYTNKKAIKYNKIIRKHVLGIDTMEPQVGEELVANTTVKEYDNEAGGDVIIIANNERVRVLGTEAGEEWGLNGWWTKVINIEKDEYTVFVPESPTVKDRELKRMSYEAKEAKAEGKSGVARYIWSEYFNVLNKTADLRPTFAITVAKAQGSTYEHVLVDMNNIDRCWDREAKARMAYTAVSRASNKVTVDGSLI
jgi:exodeoxyribonuclease-5